MRTHIPIITNLYHRLKSKPGLVILFIVLVSIITLLFVLSSSKSTPADPSLHPDSLTPANSNIIPFSSPEPFQASSLNLTKPDQIFAINQQNSYLIKITPKTTTTIYPHPVKNFSYNYPYLAIIPKNNKNSLQILNLETNDLNQSISLNSISSLIDVSFTLDQKGFYILANLDPIKRTTDLYYLSLDNPTPQKISTTKATNLQALADQNVLLFSHVDAQDLSLVSIISPNSKTIFSTTANHYLTSPSKASICTISSNQITTFNLKDQSQKTHNLEKILGGYYSSDSNLVLFRNTPEGVTQTTITALTTTPSFALIPSLKDKTLRSILGYLDNKLYAINYFNQLIKISL